MPRKRKRDKNGDLIPLHFIESPLNGSRPPLSPYQTAINPITARTIAVEDIQDVSWITPPFDSRQCQSRRCLAQSTTKRMTRLGKKSSPDLNSSNIHSKYQPLTFVGNCNHNKNASHVNIRTQTDTNTPTRTVRHRKENILNRTTSTPIEHPADSPDDSDTNSSIDNISLKISTPILGDKHSNSGASPSMSIIPDNHSHFPHHGSSKKYPKRLFSRLQPIDLELDSPTSTSTPSINSSDALNKGHSNPTRNHPRHLMLEELTSSCRSTDTEVQVLVTDTPECDYDLTFRQKQIKYYNLRHKQHHHTQDDEER